MDPLQRGELAGGSVVDMPPLGCDPDAIKLFVGNVPLHYTEQQLMPVFQQARAHPSPLLAAREPPPAFPTHVERRMRPVQARTPHTRDAAQSRAPRPQPLRAPLPSAPRDKLCADRPHH